MYLGHTGLTRRGVALFRRGQPARTVRRSGLALRAAQFSAAARTRSSSASSVCSRPLGTVVAEIARNVSAARSVAQLRWPLDRRRKRTAAANEDGDEDNDARLPHKLSIVASLPVSVILTPPHDRPARAAHPHVVALQPALQITTATVLLEEGGESVEEEAQLIG